MLDRSYPVFKWRGEEQVTVGNVLAKNLTLANVKAQRLFGNRAWAKEKVE